MAEPTDADKLRLLLWERIPENGSETDTLLTDVEIAVILELGGGNMRRAAAIGWAIKGGYYSEMIDMNESGSTRRLNQLFTNAERMWKQFDKEALTIEVSAAAASGRVPGQGFSILGEDRCALANTLFAYYQDTTYTRMFPLKRFFPAIMQ